MGAVADGGPRVAAAHNVGLLDDLEKEELFLVEKDESGATRVHGAQDVRGLRRVNRPCSRGSVRTMRRRPDVAPRNAALPSPR